MAETKTAVPAQAAQAAQAAEVGLLDQIVDQGRFGKDAPAKERGKDLIRRFVSEVLASMKPHLAFTVENKLSEDPEAGKLGVDLHFESLDDFAPDQVARQVKPLREMLELRTKLADLRGTLQGNDKLEEILQATMSDEDKMKRLKAEMGTEGGSDG